jgi:hypothetical protein
MELFVKFVLSLALTIVIKVGVAAFGHWIVWWAAALIAFVVVFGGFLLLDDDADWFA